MSDFIESEAEESEEEFEEKDLKPKKTQRFMEDDGKMFSCLKPHPGQNTTRNHILLCCCV